MQAGILLEALAQAHLLGQGNHQVAIVAFWQFLGQGMGQGVAEPTAFIVASRGGLRAMTEVWSRLGEVPAGCTMSEVFAAAGNSP